MHTKIDFCQLRQEMINKHLFKNRCVQNSRINFLKIIDFSTHKCTIKQNIFVVIDVDVKFRMELFKKGMLEVFIVLVRGVHFL